MKTFSKFLTVLTITAACIGFSGATADQKVSFDNISSSSNSNIAKVLEQTTNNPQQVAGAGPAAPAPQRTARSPNKAIQVIAPQDGLEVAIRSSEQGDILLLGPDGWYRIEAKTLGQGIRMFVLSRPGTDISAFPKERGQTPTR